MPEIKWKTDTNGILSGVGYHDGTILSVSLSAKEFVFSVRNTREELVTFALSDVYDTHIDVSLFPIVAYVSVWPLSKTLAIGSLVPSSAWIALYGNLAGGPEEIFKCAERLRNEKPDALVVVVDCAYGGQMAAACARLSIVAEAAQ